MQSVEPGRTPLQDDLDHLGSILGKAALVIVAAIVALYAWRGSPLLEMFILGIALALAVAPTCEHNRRSRCRPYLAQRDRDADASGETRTVTRSGQDGPRPPDAGRGSGGAAVDSLA